MTNECKVYEEYGIKQQPVYSGSRNALSNIIYPFKCYGEACMGVIFYPAILPYSLIDLPFSFVADTIALPYTYNLQFNVCPSVNWAALSEKRNLLEERICFYYSDYSNPEHLWALASSGFKGNMTKEEFIAYLYKNDFIYPFKNGSFVTETIIIDKNKARVLIYDKLTQYTTLPWYDYWRYEGDTWYIDQPNRKTEYSLMLEKQKFQR
ncbi:MAG TPA: YceK/YidQ family lipoprotein [Nitrospirota bacterium]|nr:YceK/YidQ family lipoprotein [Nitrospirota bacterium]